MSKRSGMECLLPLFKRPDPIEYDRPLIAKARAGNPVAARELMEKYGLRVLTYEELREYGGADSL